MNSVDASFRPSQYGRLKVRKSTKEKSEAERREARIRKYQQRAAAGVCIFTGLPHREAYGVEDVTSIPDDELTADDVG